MQRLKNADDNRSETGLRLVEKVVVSQPITQPQRAKRLCECGCGEWFVPTRNQHLYVDRKHSQARFINDKKDALTLFLDEFLVQYGASPETAARRAIEASDFYFNAWCKCLARCGYVYDTKSKTWKSLQSKS